MNLPKPPATVQVTSNIPKNSVRLRMLKRSEIVMLTSWINPPPAVPCSALAAISIDILTLVAAKMPIVIYKRLAVSQRNEQAS